MIELNAKIKILGKKYHTKASEEYVEVIFDYTPDENWKGLVPIVYRRTGLNLKTDEEIMRYLNLVYEEMKPEKYFVWLHEQENFWCEKPNAYITREFFDTLASGKWKCVNCDLPKNPNWARRIQDLKEFGYTIATDTKKFCEKCNQNTTHLILLPIPRLSINGNGYETWSPKLRKKIINVLNRIDVYEDTVNPNVLPDHKFSEIRWDENTRSINSDDMSEDEIKEKFQLLTNQRNLQKREICRNCLQTGKRGIIFGIPFFYQGNENWDEKIPQTGEGAIRGCIGCPWYDIEKWRQELLKRLKECDENEN